jgi:phospholipid transport system substrate-binding protein
MNYKLSQLCSASVVVMFVLQVAALAEAGLPTDQTRTTVDKVISILQQSGPRKEEKRQQLRDIIYSRFDFAEMAKRSLGPHWSRRTPQEQQQFTKVFADLLESSYVDKIEGYNGEKVSYTREQQDKDSAEVFTKVITKKNEEFSINYKLHPVDGEWKVYDVVVEDISLVNNYRSQFNRVLANASFDELMKKLQQKTPDLKAPGGKKG